MRACRSENNSSSTLDASAAAPYARAVPTPLRWDMILPNGEPLRFDMPGAKWDGTVEELNLSTPNRPMQQNDISITITSAAEADVLAKAEALRASIAAFAVTLTPQQRDAYFKLGDARLAFHDKSNNHMHQHPTLVPPTVDVPQYDKDATARDSALRMKSALTGPVALLDDTLTVLGSDLINADVAFYNWLPLAIRANTPGAEAVHADLKASWPGRGPGPKPPKPPTP